MVRFCLSLCLLAGVSSSMHGVPVVEVQYKHFSTLQAAKTPCSLSLHAFDAALPSLVKADGCLSQDGEKISLPDTFSLFLPEAIRPNKNTPPACVPFLPVANLMTAKESRNRVMRTWRLTAAQTAAVTSEQQQKVLEGPTNYFGRDFWHHVPHRLSCDELVRHADVIQLESLPADKWPTMDWGQVFALSPLLQEQAIACQDTPLTFEDCLRAKQDNIFLDKAKPDVFPKLSVEQVHELGRQSYQFPSDALPQDLTAANVKRLGHLMTGLDGKVTFVDQPLSIDDIDKLAHLSVYFPKKLLPQVATPADCKKLGGKVTYLPSRAFVSLSEEEIDTLSSDVQQTIREKRSEV